MAQIDCFLKEKEQKAIHVEQMKKRSSSIQQGCCNGCYKNNTTF